MLTGVQLDLAYIGPGAGFAFIGSFLTLLVSLFASVVSLLVWPFRLLWLSAKRRGRPQAQVRKTILLGLDGFDPQLAERWMDEGKLPNLRRLKEQGYYSHLRTTFPALSPVAWSTFATGVNPGKHNIFDFLNRDLRTYAPELSSAKVRTLTRVFRVGKWRIPFSRVSVEMRRKSEPFWKILGRDGIQSTILRVPITFPPEKFPGRLLSAMSTPDLRGTQGTFSWFSTKPESLPCEGGVRFPLIRNGARLEGSLVGPATSLIAFQIVNQSELHIQDQVIPLRTGEYTPWVRLRFPAGKFSSAHGIVRFLLTATSPEVSLYATPIEIDPESPALPISYPSHYAVYLAKLLGSFATLGMAEDTWALNEGAIDEDAFLAQSKSIQQEREAMFFSALEHTRRGVVACVFDTTDRVQHMFYRYLDPARQAHATSPHAASPHDQVIEDLYRDTDRIVGRTLPYVDDATALFVLSDHGFCSFRRGVNLNAWLLRNGYLTLLDGLTEGGDYFEGIDWTRTRAYTFGLSGIYLNLLGREAQGTVAPDTAGALKAELIAALNGLTDTTTGEIAIQQMYEATAIYSGPYTAAAPDLIAGYASGYRASWSAAVGKVTAEVFEDNTKCWSGDHCVDPAIVPGVLFSNRKFNPGNPGIEDMAPTVLNLFGVPKPGWMEGQSLCEQP